MPGKNARRDSASRSFGAKVLLASMAGTVATGRAAMVVNPVPDNVYTALATAPVDGQLQTDLAVLSASYNLSETDQNEIQLEINTINTYTLQLNSSEGKSSVFPPGGSLGPDRFVGTIVLTLAVAEGYIVGADTEFTESEAQIEGTGAAYYGFTVTPPSTASRGQSGASLEAGAPLYGWVKLDGSGSVLDPDAPERSERVTVSWAYDDSGQAVIVGSTQPVPEASTLSLVAVGSLLAGAAWRRRRIKPEMAVERSRVAQGRWQVWEARQLGLPTGLVAGDLKPGEDSWVVVAGEPASIVGMATLRKAEEMLHVPKEEGVRLEIQMEPDWDKGPAAEALLGAALTQARRTSARQALFVSGKERLVELARRQGFAKVARKESYHGRAQETAAWLRARYQKALARNPVEVRPIREANLDAVRRLVAAARLLTVEQVQEREPGGPDGFDAAYSFFAGEAERPAAVILGFAHQGRVRLHVRVRDAEARDFPRHGMICLMIAFLEAVAGAGIEEVSFVTRSGGQADFGTLARRWGGQPEEFLETLRLAL